ncbi:double-strand break repair helicase AddA [Flavisphingomonas formosensis]|uniref:double-strand break repair helicase AddA n=1 Tax=Flavisphingomonas formosensis TaxID=861534 RepID=UPI0012FB7D06|nr:double-strand break repair helicase AddA [Sphingomonas formosensis]
MPLSPLIPLQGEQLAASGPRENVWLSASAGTGKTHVLTARVLRLLVNGADPSSILCLTFTKAGAAEMADRIHARLAYWVRLPDRDLRKELRALGEAHDDAAVAHARTLFARVLDAAGGGLRIQTIHAFCQTLLAGFPIEAGLVPGFRPLEGREEATLRRATLADLLVQAESGGDLGLIDDVRTLSRRLGETEAESFLFAAARAPDALETLGPRQAIEPRLRRALDVPAGDVAELLAAACADDAFDMATLRLIASANAQWGTATGLSRADLIARWQTLAPSDRAEMLDAIHQLAVTGKGELRKIEKGLEKIAPDYGGAIARLADRCGALIELRTKAALAALLAAGLRAGQAYARAWTDAKRAAGAVDFDDLIRSAVALLEQDGMGDWVRYKLDQATDHILVDEAQDTNVQQWKIVAALAGEFFAGEGARSPLLRRTIFTVGDFKQAIFGFQGTSPDAFVAARHIFGLHADAAGYPFAELSLDRSFRSTPPILALVDRLLDDLGHDALGLDRAAPPHLSARRGRGSVRLWRPFFQRADEEEGDEGEEGWIDDATRAFASRLAEQIAAWLGKDPLFLATRGRHLRPEDVLILVRKRTDLASLLVARLHAEGVPVAGVDRLRLAAPLAIKDLLAAIRFVLQPEDDLNLAGLLVSPLFGLSQNALYALGHGRSGSLFRSLLANPGHAGDAAILTRLLDQADFTTPYRFLEDMLSGPLDGRRKLLRRLGQEARDPIEELLNAALAFESDSTPSLQRFLDWFDRGDVEITRDPSAPLDAVRVMTVHGSKGLQAPLVILADATVDPDNSRRSALEWELEEGAPAVPVFRPRKDELLGSLARDAEASARRDRQEHWRLLYVALTRAEEHLVVAGALGPRAAKKGEAPEQSWHAAVERALSALGSEWVEEASWGAERRHEGGEASGLPTLRTARAVRAAVASPEPEWLRALAPREARPPRPLAPSAPADDDSAYPPPNARMLEAAERGRLLHALFERLPAVAAEQREAHADRWLRLSAGVADEALRRSLIASASAIVDHPDFRDLFGPDALAEAPIAAIVAQDVVAGTVDRLLVGEERIRVVDFKTGRRVPADAMEVPAAHLRQMAAYAAALAVIFPGKPVDAALLYTAGPVLIPLPDVLLAPHKPGFLP